MKKSLDEQPCRTTFPSANQSGPLAFEFQASKDEDDRYAARARKICSCPVYNVKKVALSFVYLLGKPIDHSKMSVG